MDFTRHEEREATRFFSFIPFSVLMSLITKMQSERNPVRIVRPV